jgi:hypothetical protein
LDLGQHPLVVGIKGAQLFAEEVKLVLDYEGRNRVVPRALS